jgi:hypothetical protein
LLDYNFKVLERDTLILDYEGIDFGDIRLNQYPTRLGEDEYLFTEKILGNGENKLFLRYTDQDLNVKAEYTSEDFNQEVNFASIRRISDDGTKLLYISLANISHPDSMPRYDIIILDRQGKILNKVKMDQGYDINYDILKWNDDNSLKIIGTRWNFTENNRPYQVLEIIDVDKNGKSTIIKKYNSSDSLRTFIIPTVTELPNNKFLLRFREAAQFREPPFGQLVNDFLAKATGHMLVDGSYFDIKSNVDEIVSSPQIKLYPSITSSEVHLKFDDEFSGKLEIYSIEGVFWNSFEARKVSQVDIDCTSLSNGLYVIKIFDKENKHSSKIIKFIKM